MSTSENTHERPGAANDHRSIVLLVSAPNTPDPEHMPFKIEALVGDAADEAAEKFGYSTGGTPSFRFNGTVLDRGVTLVAAGLKNKDAVELVSAGGGV